MDILKERNEIEAKYQWDLTGLFADDAAWEKALGEFDALVAATAAFEGKLDNAEAIRGYLDASTAMERQLDNLFTYASLRRSEDTRAETAQRMYARIYGKYVQAMTATAFAQPEILRLSEDELKKIAADPLLKDYTVQMAELIRQKPHTLSPAEEKLLASFGEALSAPGQISENLMDADMTFASVKDGEGKDVEVTASNFILLQNSNDRVLRENAFRSFYAGYKGHINTFAATYAGNVKAAVAEAAARHYRSSREMSMSANNIPESVYDQLVETVHRHLPTMHRYAELRKRILGLDELHYFDLYAPLVQGVDKRYSYEEAQKMVLAAVAPLGEDYQSIARSGFENRWIDVYPNKGKTGGAYSSGSYDSNPFIMTNFTGTLDSVSTIAHEMGHSMHTWFSTHNQPCQNAGYTLFVAEVASTVNENLMIEQLLKDCDDPKERLFLLNEYLEGFKGTVYRQTMFAEFEKKAHALAEAGEALDPATLNGIYKELIEQYFGPALVMDDEVQYEWSRIPHFYNPFYVYVYATGYSTAVALSEGILRDGESAVKKYKEFLSMGGSLPPLEELKHAGVDLTTPAPVDTALNKFAAVLADAEATAKKLGL